MFNGEYPESDTSDEEILPDPDGEFLEDEHPQVKKVTATRRTGVRYDSAAGFIYHHQKIR